MVFKSKEFRIALLISLLWHLIWLSAVSITLIPNNVRFPKFSMIAFIGSVLSDTVFEPKFDLYSIGMQSLAINIDKGRKEFELDILPILKSVLPNEEISKEVVEPGVNKKILITLSEIIPKFKEISGPLSASSIFDKIFTDYSYNSISNFELEGVKGKEQIPLYKPLLPKYSDILKKILDYPLFPSWEEEGIYGSELVFKVLISFDGKVKFVEKTVSSGHPMIDNIGMRYIMNWQFAPLNQQTNQWRTVRFSFSQK